MLEKGLGLGVRVVRVMPNRPTWWGRARASPRIEGDRRRRPFVRALLGLVGLAVAVDERLLDMTGLSGSGRRSPT
jgi:pyrroline-5-carboxylate reductase